MALRLQTTQATAEGASFAPSGETILQGSVQGEGNPVIDVVVRVHADAPWKVVSSFRPRLEPFKRIAEFPMMKIAVRRNSNGAIVSVWDKA